MERKQQTQQHQKKAKNNKIVLVCCAVPNAGKQKIKSRTSKNHPISNTAAF